MKAKTADVIYPITSEEQAFIQAKRICPFRKTECFRQRCTHYRRTEFLTLWDFGKPHWYLLLEGRCHMVENGLVLWSTSKERDVEYVYPDNILGRFGLFGKPKEMIVHNNEIREVYKK